MTRQRPLVLVPMLLLPVGCASQMNAEYRSPIMKVAGVVAKSAAGPDFAFADFGKSSYDGQPFTKLVLPHKPFTTTQYVKLTLVQQGRAHDYDYFAVFGPEPGGDEVAMARMNNSEPVLEISSGWAYLNGSYPNALITKDSDWVSAGAQGTKMLVRIVEGQREYYVVLLEDNTSGATINYETCNGSTGTIDNTAGGGWYIKVEECDVTESHALPVNLTDPLRQWLNSAKLIYSAAN